MKKFFICLVILALGFELSAQNISNPSFENWNGSTNPTDWTTSINGTVNISVPIIGNYPLPINLNFATKTTDKHSGNYALKLTANSIDLSLFSSFISGVEIPESITLPGIAQLGTAGGFEVDAETLMSIFSLDTNSTMEDIQAIDWAQLGTIANVISRGVAFPTIPSSMKVWMKYLPPTGVTDTMTVFIVAYNQGQDIISIISGDEDPAGYAFHTISGRIEDYTEMTFNVEHFSASNNCDSLAIIFLSTSFLSPNENTELYLDDITFQFDQTAISNYDQSLMSIYPNPAAQFVNIAPKNLQSEYSIELYDMNGRQICQKAALTGQYQLSLDNLARGTYLLKLRQQNETSLQKLVVE